MLRLKLSECSAGFFEELTEFGLLARAKFEVRFDRFYYSTHADLAELLGMDRLPKEARIVDKRG